METKFLKSLSRSLHVPEEQLLAESIVTFLDRELRNASLEIQKIKQKYTVNSPKELEKKIEQGTVKEHPAWEELIEWENMEKRIDEVRKWMKNLPIYA